MPHHKHRHHHGEPHHPHLPDNFAQALAAADGDHQPHPHPPSRNSEPHHGVEDGEEEQQLHLQTADHHQSEEEKIANLTHLNEDLIKKVVSSRAAEKDLDGKVKGMEEELKKVVSREDELLLENNWMTDEKRKLELEVSSLRKEVDGLGSEKTSLLAEKQDLLESKLATEDSLAKSRADLQDTREQLQEAGRAEAVTQEEAKKLKAEVEKLLLEKGGLAEEIDALNARTASLEGDLKLLQERKEFLDEEISNVRNACAAAEAQVADAKTVIEALHVEASSRTAERDQLEIQLKDARQRITNLEAEQKAAILKHDELESQSKNFESDLITARNAHESTSQVLKQEREATGSLNDLLATANEKSRSLEEYVDSLKSSLVKREDDTNRDQQRISCLESEVSSLGSEKASLEDGKSSLEDEVRMLNSTMEKATAATKTEKEKLAALARDLEKALADATERVSQRNKNVLESRLARLAWSFAAVTTGAFAVMGMSAVFRRSK